MKKLTITITKKLPSLNKWYAGGHWAIRLDMKRKASAIFEEQLQDCQPMKFVTYEILIESNTAYDIDNNIPAAKMFVDTLVKRGWVLGDSKAYYKKLTITHNAQLAKNSLRITIIEKPSEEGPVKSKTKKTTAK